MLKSPLTWTGGKSHMATMIASLLPEHDHYIEVFGGALNVLFAKPVSKIETVNDINGDLVNFWMVCRDNYKELMCLLDFTPYSRELFERWKKQDLKSVDDTIERAARFFFLNNSSFAAVYHGGWSYMKAANSVGKSPAESFRAKIERILDARDRLKYVHIEKKDFEDMIQTYGGYEKNVLYLDPPYVGKNHYRFSMSEADHGRLAASLRHIKAKVIISYYKHPLVEELYLGDDSPWSVIYRESKVKSAAKVKAENGQMRPRGHELLISNYPIQLALFPKEVRKLEEFKLMT